jgi:hypothetical protein
MREPDRIAGPNPSVTSGLHVGSQGGGKNLSRRRSSLIWTREDHVPSPLVANNGCDFRCGGQRDYFR